MLNDDPRTAKTLGEACANGDGTFNGIKLMSWLSEIVNPGKGLSVDEVKTIVEEIKEQNHANTRAIQSSVSEC